MISPKRIAGMLNALAFVLIVWGLFPGYHYGLMVIAFTLTPIVALLIKAKYPELFRLDWIRKDPQPNISRFFLVPGFALFICALRDYNIINWQPVFILALLVAFAMDMAVVKVSGAPLQINDGRFKRAIILGLLLLPYGLGVVLEANALLDFHAYPVYKAQVLGKYMHGGPNPSWALRVGPWESVPVVKRISVTRAVFDSTQEGGQACIGRHVGALYISWYQPELCRNP